LSNQFAHFLKAVINSYAIVFFSQSRLLGGLLLLVSFFNVTAGASGLFGVLLSIVYTTYTGYQRQDIEKGLFSFNALLLGIGFGTFYHVNTAFFIWLFVACLLCIFITINLWAWFSKHNLPFLSLPFIITFWLLLSAANSIFQMGLQQNSSAILNELNDAQNMHTPGIFGLAATLHFPGYINLFFKSLSAVFFQNSAIAGLLISIGILLWSRIAFSVLVLSFAAVLLFNGFINIYPEGLSHYHLGSNFMLTAMAIGSFFLIASWRSYVWSIVAVLFTFLLINAFTRLIGLYDLPVLPLPFCAITIGLLTLFKTQQRAGKTRLTPLQYYSPEKNLYQYLNGKQRLFDLQYFDIKLPFMGSWLVSQGYNGNITHKDEWGQALDFVITDDDYKTYRLPGTLPEHYYCYNKPVLACGDGVVAELIDHVEDNPIGIINTNENWGNTIVIKHTDGLYSKVSHLKKGSIKVTIGTFVKQGDVIAMCGNSGRSPEPHLHFQLQATPYIGSKTLAYPFSYYTNQQTLKNFNIPQEGELVSPVIVNSNLKKAFDLQPGYVARVVTSKGNEDTFEVHTDAFKQTYLYSKNTGAIAYFINNGTSLYFTGFYGDDGSLLYYFYLAAYKILFKDDSNTEDAYPLPSTGFNAGKWLQDLAAPFYQYTKFNYQSSNIQSGINTTISSTQRKQLFGTEKLIMQATITVEPGSIQGFTVNYKGNKVQAKWIAGNTY